MIESSGFRPHAETGGTIVDDRIFRFLVDLEIQKAQRMRYCVSVLCLATEPSSYGVLPSGPLANIVSRHIRATDTVTPGPQTSLSVLLVDADITNVPGIVRRMTADLDDFPWSAGGACYPQTATGGEDMMRQAASLMARAKGDGAGRLYLASHDSQV